MLEINPRKVSREAPGSDEIRAAAAVVFDIETRPQSFERLMEIAEPFLPPPEPGEFDPGSVKTGNLGADKAAAKIEAARADHETLKRSHGAVVQVARDQWQRSLVEKAALSPLTGEVCAIGISLISQARGQPRRNFVLTGGDDDEGVLLDHWWGVVLRWRRLQGTTGQFVGFNCYGFDLPFLLRRSWILGVEPTARPERNYWGPPFVDLMQIWSGGNRGEQFTRLDVVARALGCGSKSGDGQDFGELLKTSPDEAMAYLVNDLEMTARVAGILGVF